MNQITNLQQYQDLAVTTRQYPIPRYEIIYPILGLVGEIGEMLEADDNNNNLKKEFGDCFWYLAVFSYDLGFRLGENELCTITIDNEMNLIYQMCKLCEQVKKLFRDGNTTDRLISIKILINTIINHLYSMLKIMKLDIWEILTLNIEKLLSRKERGVIKGDGDNR